MVQTAWNFITSGNGLLQAIIIALVSALVARLFTPRGRLVWSTSHQHFYSIRNLEGGNFPVRTQQLWFQNTGRAAIDDVEIILNYEPQHLEVWNPRAYTKAKLDDGRLVLTFPYLAAREYFTISMLDTIGDLPVLLMARSKSGLGKQINMGPQQIFPRWVSMVLWAFIFFGFSSMLWFAIQPFLWVAAVPPP